MLCASTYLRLFVCTPATIDLKLCYTFDLMYVVLMYLTSWRSCPIVVSALVPPDVSTRCVSVSGRLHYSKQCFEYFMQILFLSIRLSPGCYLYWWTRVNLNCCDACCMYRNIMITQTWTTCVCYVGRHDATTFRVIFGTWCLNVLISFILVYSLHFWVSCEYW